MKAEPPRRRWHGLITAGAPHAAAQPGQAWLAQHYRWGLGRVFDGKRRHSHVVVLEDDMVFSPDFLLYFQVSLRRAAMPHNRFGGPRQEQGDLIYSQDKRAKIVK